MKCDCPGNQYDKWHNWRVIDSTSKMRRVYCLQCRRSWLSKAKYTAIMKTHTPQKRSGMTDADILKRIKDGSLVVCEDGTQVTSIANGRSRDLTIFERESNGSTYRFVEISKDRKKKKIALHRLVWMAANMKVVPDGFDVDHIDGPSDAIDNLRLLPQSINRACTSRTNQTVPDDYDEGF